MTVPAMRKFTVPEAHTTYPPIGNIYVGTSRVRPAYEIDMPDAMTFTGKNLFDSETFLREGERFSTAPEELAIQLDYERKGINPRSDAATALNDLFGRNAEKRYIWQWTSNFLCVPEGNENPEQPDIVINGIRYWIRKYGNRINSVDVIEDQVLVPEGGVVPRTKDFEDVWDTVHGIPHTTSNKAPYTEYENHTTHFLFDPNEKEVAVARRSDWHDDHHDCLAVVAHYRRSSANSLDGFCPVRGSIPKMIKE